MHNSHTIDMTHGTLLNKIIQFSLPLIASNILQLLFNAADMVVIGQFASHTSLAAVGSTTSIIFLFINLLIGLSVGVNVVVARYLGATGHEYEISRTVHTALSVAILGGIAVGLFAGSFAVPLLDLASTPRDVKPLAALYMRIYFVGTPAVMLYNYGAAALRAKGDTRRPLLFMTLSGIVNVVLNVLFVAALEMDVAGVALATVISQIFSAGLTLFCLSREPDAIRFKPSKLCIDKQRLIEMAKIGVPAGLQSSMFSIANIAIQKGINSYGSIETAASSAAFSIEGFVYTAMNAYYQTCQTFTSQNIGAGYYERARKVFYRCALCSACIGAVLSSAVLLFAEPLMGLYSPETNVITAGIRRLFIIIPLYVVYGFSDVLVGAMYGRGHVLEPVVINLLGTCVFRIVWIAFLDIPAVPVAWVYLAFPVSWVLLTILLFGLWICVLRSESGRLH